MLQTSYIRQLCDHLIPVVISWDVTALLIFAPNFDDHVMPQLYLVKNHAGRYHWPGEWGRLDLSPMAKSELSGLSTFWSVTLPYHFFDIDHYRSILLLHCQHSHQLLQAASDLVLAPPKMWFSGDTEAIPPLPTRERRRLILDILVFGSMFRLLHGWVAWHGLTWLDMAWHGLTWLDMAWHGLTWLDMAWQGKNSNYCNFEALDEALKIPVALGSLFCETQIEWNEFSFLLVFLCFLANKFKLCRLQCAQLLVEVVDPDEEWNQRLRGTGAAGRLAT